MGVLRVFAAVAFVHALGLCSRPVGRVVALEFDWLLRQIKSRHVVASVFFAFKPLDGQHFGCRHRGLQHRGLKSAGLLAFVLYDPFRGISSEIKRLGGQ